MQKEETIESLTEKNKKLNIENLALHAQLAKLELACDVNSRRYSNMQNMYHSEEKITIKLRQKLSELCVDWSKL
jgi:regulator of replication initiation timing